MKNSEPTVSVIIPTYNRAGLIEQAIQSVRAQTFEDWELIVVDDASKDDTRNVVCSINDAKIQYVRHEVNRGGSAARNTGLRRAKGKYVLMLDDDDVIKKTHITNLVGKHQTIGKGWGVVYTGFILDRKDKQNKVLPKWKGCIINNLLTEGSIGTTAVALIKKKVIQEVGGFDESLSRHQDLDLYIRMSKITQFYPLKVATVVKKQTGKPELKKVIESKKRLRQKHSNEISNLGFIERRKFYSREYLRLSQLSIAERKYLVGLLRLLKSLVQYPFQPKRIIGTLYNNLFR